MEVCVRDTDNGKEKKGGCYYCGEPFRLGWDKKRGYHFTAMYEGKGHFFCRAVGRNRFIAPFLPRADPIPSGGSLLSRRRNKAIAPYGPITTGASFDRDESRQQ